MSVKVYWIRTIARHAAASPPIKRALIGILNRVPVVKSRLKRALARANTLESQRLTAARGSDADDALLSSNAQRALALLRHERTRAEASRAAEVRQR